MYDPVLFQKWVTGIEEHQKFDHSKINYNICIKHFQPTDFEIRGNKRLLKKEVVPTIFGVVNNSQVLDSDFNECSSAFLSKCFECTTLKAKLSELEKENQLLRMNHDVKVQKLSKKIESLQILNENLKKSVAIIEKKISQRESQILKLEAKNTELNKKNCEKHFNDDEIDFKKVRFLIGMV